MRRASGRFGLLVDASGVLAFLVLRMSSITSPIPAAFLSGTPRSGACRRHLRRRGTLARPTRWSESSRAGEPTTSSRSWHWNARERSRSERPPDRRPSNTATGCRPVTVGRPSRSTPKSSSKGPQPSLLRSHGARSSVEWTTTCGPEEDPRGTGLKQRRSQRAGERVARDAHESGAGDDGGTDRVARAPAGLWIRPPGTAAATPARAWRPDVRPGRLARRGACAR